MTQSLCLSHKCFGEETLVKLGSNLDGKTSTLEITRARHFSKVCKKVLMSCLFSKFFVQTFAKVTIFLFYVCFFKLSFVNGPENIICTDLCDFIRKLVNSTCLYHSLVVTHIVTASFANFNFGIYILTNNLSL